MPTATIEERLTLLEQKVAHIAPAETASFPPPTPPLAASETSTPFHLPQGEASHETNVRTDAVQEPAWWKRIVGVYRNDPEFAEAERLGREYRESLRPQESE